MQTTTAQGLATQDFATEDLAARPRRLARLGATIAAAILAATAAASPAVAAPGTGSPGADGTGGAGIGQRACSGDGSTTTHTLVSGGIERRYRLHLPTNTAQRSLPVLIAFHGRGSTAAEIEEFSQLDKLPVIVVYPDGVVGTGHDDRQAWQGAPYAAPGVDDVRFTSDLIDELLATTCADQRRVHATGKSNGGGFTALLACRLDHRIASISPVAGAFYPGTAEGCTDSDPKLPLLAIHGTADTTIPYQGDTDRGLPALPAWVDGWVQRDRCGTRTETTFAAPDTTITRWERCHGSLEVVHAAVAGGGHRWPGADIDSGGSGTTTQAIDSADLIGRFINAHHLTANGDHR